MMLTLLHQDLEKIEHAAWISCKRGQQGVYYPEAMIRFRKSFYMIFINSQSMTSRALVKGKPDSVPADFVSEALILRSE